MMRIMIRQRQIGLSLVELMVAITLSMLLMLGVIQMFLGSKTAYVSNQELSQVQESGRFALEFLTRDIRNAGYKGQCMGLPVNHVSVSEDALWSRAEGAVLGWSSGSAPAFVEAPANSEGLFIQFAAGGNEDYEGIFATNTSTNSEIKWHGTDFSSHLKKDDVAIIADGLGCDLFENDSDSSNSIKKKENRNRNWSHDYTDSFELLRLESLAYYVADDQGTPTLYRKLFDYGLNIKETHALVSGVAAMQLEYGVGRGANLERGIITEYVAADSVNNWEEVLAVKVTLTLEAESGLQKNFSTLIGLRNRLP